MIYTYIYIHIHTYIITINYISIYIYICTHIIIYDIDISMDKSGYTPTSHHEGTNFDNVGPPSVMFVGLVSPRPHEYYIYIYYIVIKRYKLL